MKTKIDNQKLVDLIFDMGIALGQNRQFNEMSTEQIATIITKSLKENDIHVVPCG